MNKKHVLSKQAYTRVTTQSSIQSCRSLHNLVKNETLAKIKRVQGSTTLSRYLGFRDTIQLKVVLLIVQMTDSPA